jgi:hypothetical protein
MTTREQVVHELDALGDRELEYAARLIEALRSRPPEAPPPSFDPAVYGPLYREYAAADCALAELGMTDYARGLEAEDNGRQRLPEEDLRRRRVDYLLATADRLAVLPLPPLTEAELNSEIQAARAQRREPTR